MPMSLFEGIIGYFVDSSMAKYYEPEKVIASGEGRDGKLLKY